MTYKKFEIQQFDREFYPFTPETEKCKGHWSEIDVPMRECMDCGDRRLFDYYDHCCCFPLANSVKEINDLYEQEHFDILNDYDCVIDELKYTVSRIG